MQQQVVKRRVKRDLIEIDASRSKRSPRDRSDRPSKRAQTSNSSPKSRSLNLYLNDPKWTQMWYLVSLPTVIYFLSIFTVVVVVVAVVGVVSLRSVGCCCHRCNRLFCVTNRVESLDSDVRRERASAGIYY